MLYFSNLNTRIDWAYKYLQLQGFVEVAWLSVGHIVTKTILELRIIREEFYLFIADRNIFSFQKNSHTDFIVYLSWLYTKRLNYEV